MVVWLALRKEGRCESHLQYTSRTRVESECLANPEFRVSDVSLPRMGHPLHDVRFCQINEYEVRTVCIK
jgi:hypothetical protein